MVIQGKISFSCYTELNCLSQSSALSRAPEYNLFGNGGFSNVIKMRCTGSGSALNSMVGVLLRRPCEDRQKHRRQGNMRKPQSLEGSVYKPRDGGNQQRLEVAA